ncbi:MAG TPA: flagellar biosynthetic protein FliR [Tepidisphaeraceae bacterium]|nr:flagellar biosynthetic protein FliR [Tepidisphaeraceae bacterium]
MDTTLLPISLATLPALARVGGILACAPVFSSSAVPPQVRVMIAVALTVGLSPTMPAAPAAAQPLGAFALAVAGEALVGIAIGIAMNLVFVAAQWAGELIAQQLGLGLAESYDPAANTHGTVLSTAYSLLAIVVFLGVNGHHALLRGVGASFEALPVQSAVNGQSVLDMLARLLTGSASLALQLAAPVFVTLLVTDLTIGMVGKTVPQVGLMTAGIAARAIVGLLVLVLCTALTAALLQGASANWMHLVTSALPGLGTR